ncbi:twin arginine targeting protein translocase subunit TatC [Schinkia azotoformans MEV2011]|uniref:Sec-independent protein translocase protein TatC n=1 Tax=Schinkia azotoformans MEV2011 TaxID=1348973 RepID=A0A072NHR6_SCHAZ|nr:twin-arginine translocase subunit TatC [Schinkia azotoformans]KEF37239.1 twin arginine targeting protein translocase subunit TatC [Schinkia azotoformans MEV2011]MEC1697379.1 twin-arginine translocase subunit TatC [Schinkia azotoformans]MEC1714609.1 twin-arginine translocase subunit TatC [Schinkia azotoformans]MEC1724341.1 twin-arginine translocase subunit TatC [Schinkia azotoformans]MEC1742940.1 twin-arginine translocase subunit TatC [Schinkia azotoformans]
MEHIEEELTLVEHLSELRKRLIIVISAFVVALTIGFLISQKLLNYIKKAASVSIDWNVFGFTDGFLIYFKCAFIVALLFTLPIFLYQTWAFVKPGLTEDESKGTLLYVPLSFFLFIIGVAFSYFVVFPLVLDFMSTINQNIGAMETYGIAQYFTFMFNVVFPISIIFEMPVVVLFLTKLGILDPDKLRKMRKLAYFVLVVIGVSMTPPDVVSDLLIIIPLFLLFEISILCSKWSIKKTKKTEG